MKKTVKEIIVGSAIMAGCMAIGLAMLLIFTNCSIA